MSKIRTNINLIEQKHSQAITAISAGKSGDDSHDLEKLMDEVQQNSVEIRTKLKQMDKDNKQYLQTGDASSSESRIRINMHGTLTRKFVDLMSNYQEVQTKYKNKYKERVERQYKIVNPSASADEVERALENPNNIFADQIKSAGHAAAKNALADIQEKHQDILRLEASINELYQLFADMAVLVETQGELLNSIEYNVQQASAYTAKGVTELQKAKEYQKKARKKKCCLLLILVIVLVVVVALVLGPLLGLKII
mmetsp:Transcript_13304/g.34876  ORF Transcript_13304/g.34876 Transcript_13304/m.34876 type:complete len:254 (+) Transcript_13304:276-1037(+)